MEQRQNSASADNAAFVIWLAVQLVALGLFAERAALWSRAPRASEELALTGMLAMQIGASSLLFPHLLGSWRSTLLAVVTSVVMAQLAAELNEISTKALIFAQIYVISWLIVLSFLSRTLVTGWSRLFASAVVTMLSLGGPILWYLRADFSAEVSAAHLSSTLISFGPLAGAISQTRPDHPIGAWLFVAIIFVAGGIHRARKRARKKISRQVIH
jgi:hypothetical protein